MASSMLTPESSAAASAMEPNIDEAQNTTLRACANDPNFAVICAFLQKFANDLGLDVPSFKHLQEWLTRTDEVSPQLRDIQIKLLRKTRKTVHEKSWETALSKFCFLYSAQDAWEVERFGYKNAGIKVKLRILRELLESQFERNSKFKAKVLMQSADSLRSKPIGRDRLGHAYWVTQDRDCNFRIYQEHLDEDTWQVVSTNRDEFVNLITRLRGNEVVLPSLNIGVVDEDTSSSNSCPETDQKLPPPEERDDSQEEEQKVPKLSIKIVNGKSPKEGASNNLGKGEEDLAAEEDKRRNKNTGNDGESCEEEFEEIEEEYEEEEEDESNEEDDRTDNEIPGPQKNTKTVKPLVISQNKIKSTTSATITSVSRKRILEYETQKSTSHREECDQKKSRPLLLDSKKPGKLKKPEEDNMGGEEDYEDSNEEEEEVEDEVEEEDIDSAAAEEDENEEKQIEDFDDDDDDSSDVGEEITDPVFRIKGEGSGKECELGNFWGYMDHYFEDEEIPRVGDVLDEIVIYIHGEGIGNECLVGNINSDSKDEQISLTKTETKENTCQLIVEQQERENEKTTTDVMDKPKTCEGIELNEKEGCLESEEATEDKNKNNLVEIHSGTGKEQNDNVNGDKAPSNSEINIDETKSQTQEESCETINSPTTQQRLDGNEAASKTIDNSEQQTLKGKLVSKHYATTRNLGNKLSALETLKKELRESKQKSLEHSAITPLSLDKKTSSGKTISTTWNRKRRLEEFAFQQANSGRSQNSESEIDINSENTEEFGNDHDDIQVDEPDVGGKRLKMRQKQSNTELRKKIEAQKAAVNDETTSSSGGEEQSRRRRKVSSSKAHTESLVPGNMSSDSSNDLSKPNGENKKADDLTGDPIEAVVHQQPSTSHGTLSSSLAHNPNLEETIDKKLKRTPSAEESKETINSATECAKTKLLFSPPKKCPVTMPLKKNLLTQIRQEESEEEPIPRKRTISEDLSSAETIDREHTKTKDINSLPKVTPDVQRLTPDRQRKRRSSEETIQSFISEEPEIKKEVAEAACSKNDDVIVISKDDCKKILNENRAKHVNEIKVDNMTQDLGRRSGRRGVSLITAEIPQAKRTRGCNKTASKNQTSTVQPHTSGEEDDKPVKTIATVLKIKDEEASIATCLASAKQFSSENKAIKEEKLLCTPQKIKSENETMTSVKATRKKREVDTTNIIEANDAETPVRQSRRIAQQKIREEAERRKLEEVALRTMKQELKKKKMAEKQSDPTVIPPSESSSESEIVSDVETKKKAQKKKCPGKNGSWSSGSEEQEDPDEEEEEYHHRYETDPGSPLFKSDHEFSPESDIEDETQVVPMKRARTARKEDAAENEIDEEEACQKCNKSDHPEWILLCDSCDKGYHCSCLSPVLFYIPEGSWYCPPCQQEQLIAALEDQLKQLDELVERKKLEAEEEKRLADEEKSRKEEEDKILKDNKKSKKASLDSGGDDDSNLSLKSDATSEQTENSNDIKSSTKDPNSNRSKKHDKRNRCERRQKSGRGARRRAQQRDSDHEAGSRKIYPSDSSSKSSSSSSSSYSDSDNEPIYKLRKRRQINVSYRLNEYDDLINSALKKEMDEAAGAGNLGRGKDISTIIEADKEEKARQKQIKDDEPNKSETADNKLDECKSPGKVVENPDKNDKESVKADSEDEVLGRKPRHKQSLKKKSRKLTTLDISSEDDNGSDEDFKGSSFDDDEEEDTSVSVSSNSDSSLDAYKRKGKSKKKQRKAARRAFRQRRKDRRFIADDSDEDEEVQRPKSKKKRKVESDYTESEIDDDDGSELSENVDSADLCDDTSTDESDGAWRPNNRKKSKKTNNTPAVSKETITKNQQPKKNKKIEYSDDDVTESEEDIDDEDDEPLGVGGGKQPRSQPLKTTPKTKTKSGNITKTKKKKSSDDCQSFSDSGDSTRRTRGRRYAYIEDFEDDSSDGGIKPGVQRPDTPPEEREKFIKRQEEIKRMLAEKNAEGAKLAATPRLTPIKNEAEKDKRSPSKTGGDSLSTVPLSVIRQAKVLDIDYLQRRGESLDDLSNDVDDVGDDFDDADLPDDLPEDMDEDAIARMVEEEEEFDSVTVRDLPTADEVLRTASLSAKPKLKENEKLVAPVQTASFAALTQQSPALASTSVLQEPVRKRLPMPTMHPPLLRHQLFTNEHINHPGQPIIQRNPAASASHLLQNALSAPLGHPQHRVYPPPAHSLVNRIPQNVTGPSAVSAAIGSCKPPPPTLNATSSIDLESQDKNPITSKEPEPKPRGRRKKITPLRDTLQKQQTAAAVAAAASATAASTAIKIRDLMASSPASVIKPGPTNKCQGSVITSFQHSSQYFPGTSAGVVPPAGGGYPGSEGFYRHPPVRLPPPSAQRHRGPPQIPTSLLASHPNMRSSYGPPPPLKGSISAPNPSGNPANVRSSASHLAQYVGVAPSPRHSGSHLNIYGPSIYGNPNFVPRGNLRPPPIHPSQYPTGSRAYPPYGFYPPPPPLTTPPPQTPRAALQQATSVIVSNTSSTTSKLSSGPASSSAQSTNNTSDMTNKSISVKAEFNVRSNPSPKPVVPDSNKAGSDTRKRLTTLETYTNSDTVTTLPLPLACNISRAKTSPGLQANLADDSSPPSAVSENPTGAHEQPAEGDGHASEFSGLVSYFSSQHDDYNT